MKIVNSPVGIKGRNFLFSSTGALVDPENGVGFIADVHLGKSDRLQQQGVPIPSRVHLADLKNVSTLVDYYQLQQLVVLGDLFDSPQAAEMGIMDEFTLWRKQRPKLKLLLVMGNHDKNYNYGIPSVKMLREGEILFTHDKDKQVAPEKSSVFTVSGHVHPVVRLKSATDCLRLKAFVMDHNSLIIPSFGKLTGGYEITPKRDMRLYAISEGICEPLFN